MRMQAMVLEAPGRALVWRERPDPEPDAGMVRIRVAACGVCRTDLHVVDGELPDIPTRSCQAMKSWAASKP
jgi:propanol-preferring alcohol dehydrogenase